MAVRGYSPSTLENHRVALCYLATWLAERGITRPGEVTKPMLDSYQRALYYRRKADGTPLSFRSQVQQLVPVRTFFRYLTRGEPDPLQPRLRARAAAHRAAPPKGGPHRIGG